jgi:hypothetical protein
MQTETALASVPQQSVVEKRIVKRILVLHPGLIGKGDKVSKAAAIIADSSLSPTATAMVLAAVYSTSDDKGRGQGTRARWFVEAVKNRYDRRLDRIRNDPKQLESFLYDMEAISDMRDNLNGEGFGCSFQAGFLLWEIGESCDSVMQLVAELYPSQVGYKGSAMAIIVRAAQLVKVGKFSELATAVHELRCGYD